MEISIGVSSALVMVLARMPFDALAGERAPYALNFLAVVIAAVFAGWRSGLIALAFGQALIWYAVVPPYFSFAIGDPERFAGLVIATASQALILVVIALYQREVDKGTAERERRMALLDHALNEIDHRTRNNHQTVLALIHLQAQRATHDGVRDALMQVANRIQAISQATERLALRSGDLERVRLNDHLCGLCEQIERGLVPARQKVREVEERTTSADLAIPIAIIVNELVTNALKHAFDGRDEGHVLVTGRMNGELRLTVTDNGIGIRDSGRGQRGGGLGSKLVENFAKQLGAKHEIVTSEQGTTHDLVIPKVA